MIISIFEIPCKIHTWTLKLLCNVQRFGALSNKKDSAEFDRAPDFFAEKIMKMLVTISRCSFGKCIRRRRLIIFVMDNVIRPAWN